jgi:membrane-bound lytic murein transglycosylase D
MGGNLLRRKILKMPFTGLKKKKVPALILSAMFAVACFFSRGGLFALETALGEESQPRDAPLFSRPLRNRPPISSYQADALHPAEAAYMDDHPIRRGVLPPSYQTGIEKKPESLLLNQRYMEHPLTQQYIRQYSNPGGLAWLSAVMNRGGPYLAFIRREIAEMKLPEELLYLPVIESGYLSTALSRSGASGLWQFMKNSMGPFDMRVDDWVDERRDFWKSTKGALRKLEENYNYFGDWALALAAYNAGLGAVSRAIRQGGVHDYWNLSEKRLLSTETIHYVPKLLAAAYVLSDPRRFGLEPRWPEDPQWRRVAVDRSADLNLLANEAGVDSGELIWANRELLYNVTPPGQSYFLKVRGRDAEKVAAALARKDIPLVHNYMHTVRSGDTLLALAIHYGITVDQIVASNPGVEARFLRIGSRLLIPAFKEIVPYESPAAARETISFEGTHLVKRGETLWSLALAYEVDPEVLAEANGMGLNDILREGRVLKTPIR